MRILGVSDATAAAHDLERIQLDEGFIQYVTELNRPRPADQSLH
jgi:hypothetical protein